MRAHLLSTVLPAVLFAALVAPACVSSFPASSLDTGRGANALPRGTTRVQVGAGGGAAPLSVAIGGGAGARVEHQFLDDLAVSADVAAGLQAFGYVPTVMPLGSYVGAQWNPFGIQWLALRARVGGGVDTPALAVFGALSPDTAPVAADMLEPYASAALQVALSMPLSERLTAYLVPGFGVKQFLLTGPTLSTAAGNIADGARSYCGTLATTCGIVDTLLFPGATAGLEARMTDALSFYVSGNLSSGLILGRQVSLRGEQRAFAVSPSANVQSGLAFTF